MNRRRLASLLAAVVAVGMIVAAYLGGQSSGLRVRPNPRHPGRYYTRFETMGTTAHLEVVADGAGEARKMLVPAAEAVRQVDRLMSTYRKGSEISRLNRNGAETSVKLHPRVMGVLQRALELCRRTDGAFDMTSGPLRKLWRDAQKNDTLPGEKELQGALAHVGCDKLLLGEGEARLRSDNVRVDLGGIAKGYAIARAAQEIAAHGGEGALVDIGGDMTLLGRRADGQRWKIRVRIPPRIDLDEHIYLEVEDRAIATSGDYARPYRVDGERYSHIIDPRTGQPVKNLPSSTVVASNATMADGLATALSVLGPEEGLQVIEDVEGAECLIIVEEADGVRIVSSEGFSEYRYHPARTEGSEPSEDGEDSKNSKDGKGTG